MVFDHYEEVPHNIAEEIIKERQGWFPCFLFVNIIVSGTIRIRKKGEKDKVKARNRWGEIGKEKKVKNRELRMENFWSAKWKMKKPARARKVVRVKNEKSSVLFAYIFYGL
jgi:hypothetical protein